MCQPNIRIELKLGEASRERVVIATDHKGKVKTMDLSVVVDAGICWQVLAGSCCAADLRRGSALVWHYGGALEFGIDRRRKTKRGKREHKEGCEGGVHTSGSVSTGTCFCGSGIRRRWRAKDAPLSESVKHVRVERLLAFRALLCISTSRTL